MTTGTHPPAAPPPDSDDELLPCGRLLSQVWAAWEDAVTDDHQRTCSHCRQAIGELEALRTSVRDLSHGTEAPDGFAAGALAHRVMDVVRLELRPGKPLPLGAPDDGMWIMESVAARTLRAAASRVPGVQASSCRIGYDDADGTGRATVSLGIQAPLSSTDLAELAENVRGQVEVAADQHLGLGIARVDIRVTDLVDVPGSTEEGHER
ncbi:Asp23/Gls24 family envelope stress response protein [Streptomyces luteolus]|uniref:Asp23/Gls24 family envelope stress response protein n=1 Tax=Streptomyces luteolus TaxID=3043615 RepID=A0ABT6STV2_9ACTN|nr:Asp23/Gls24 family envelope stress response protein [Streptomyces sp. B-S-A12]MDI3419047.1 Asp23/Gls24 family envelope stress response protein [Streptomyces sp. B-S-A12]